MTIYAPTGGLITYFQGKGWSGDAGGEYTTPGKDPGIDLTRIWGGIATDLRRKQGDYQGFKLRGMPVPRLSLKQIREIQNSWYRIGDKVWKELDGRPELMAKANKATSQFMQDVSGIIIKFTDASTISATAPFTEGGKYVWFPTASAFYDAVSKYMIALNGVIYAIANIETRLQRWMDALPWGASHLFKAGWVTARDVTPQVKAAVDEATDVAKASGSFLWTLWKWRLPIAVAAGAGFIYLKTRKGRGRY
jgi:hypothetical protein